MIYKFLFFKRSLFFKITINDPYINEAKEPNNIAILAILISPWSESDKFAIKRLIVNPIPAKIATEYMSLYKLLKNSNS